MRIPTAVTSASRMLPPPGEVSLTSTRSQDSSSDAPATSHSSVTRFSSVESSSVESSATWTSSNLLVSSSVMLDVPEESVRSETVAPSSTSVFSTIAPVESSIASYTTSLMTTPTVSKVVSQVSGTSSDAIELVESSVVSYVTSLLTTPIASKVASSVTSAPAVQTAASSSMISSLGSVVNQVTPVSDFTSRAFSTDASTGSESVTSISIESVATHSSVSLGVSSGPTSTVPSQTTPSGIESVRSLTSGEPQSSVVLGMDSEITTLVSITSTVVSETSSVDSTLAVTGSESMPSLAVASSRSTMMEFAPSSTESPSSTTRFSVESVEVRSTHVTQGASETSDVPEGYSAPQTTHLTLSSSTRRGQSSTGIAVSTYVAGAQRVGTSTLLSLFSCIAGFLYLI